MDIVNVIRSLMALTLLAVSSATLTVPASLLSPFTVPNALGPESMNAVKLAIGTRMLSVLGNLGIGSAGSLATGILNGSGMPSQGLFPLSPGYQGLTPRNKFSKRRGPTIPTSFNIREATPTEVENFFGVLHRVDSNQCISRLVCEIGANPKVLEGLGHNVKEVIGSLRVLERNNLSTKYRNILLQGQQKGLRSCSRNFPTCDAKSYRMVRTFVRAFRMKN